MEDDDKLGQLAGTLENIVSQSAGNAGHFELEDANIDGLLKGAVRRKRGELSVSEAACNWLLPCIAEWSVEGGNLWPLLVKPWLTQLDSLCTVSCATLSIDRCKQCVPRGCGNKYQ